MRVWSSLGTTRRSATAHRSLISIAALIISSAIAVKYLSLFTGIGGFEEGIKRVLEKKAVCIGFSEIDPYAIKTYTTHFPEHKNFGDITKIKEKELPDFDLLVGGFPCQSFSIAGKRKGFEDPRGQMFFHIKRILRAKKPRLLMLENVAGLLSHNHGRTFQRIISDITQLGYRVEWQVLNSANFNTAQHRTRVYIIGYRGTKPRRKVFPLSRTNPKAHRADTSQARSGIQSLYDGGYIDKKIIGTSGISPAIVSTKAPVIAVTNSSTREFGWKPDYCPALCANDRKNPKLLRLGYRIRKLTPTEAERLQAFPDGWTQGISVSQRYKSLGNAVTVNVVEAIVRKLFAR